jgi:hypothetical protein
VNEFGSILPVNFNINFKVFLLKNDFGAICIPYPDAPIPYVNAEDDTIWMRTAKYGAHWPYERVIKALPEISYQYLDWLNWRHFHAR